MIHLNKKHFERLLVVLVWISSIFAISFHFSEQLSVLLRYFYNTIINREDLLIGLCYFSAMVGGISLVGNGIYWLMLPIIKEPNSSEYIARFSLIADVILFLAILIIVSLQIPDWHISSHEKSHAFLIRIVFNTDLGIAWFFTTLCSFGAKTIWFAEKTSHLRFPR